MKNLVLVLLFVFAGTLVYGQKDSTFFFDEFAVSANVSHTGTGSNNSRVGFGLGMYHNFLKGKPVQLLFGMEYNYTGQFIKNVYGGHYSSKTDVTYRISSISLPAFFVRGYVGKRVKVFAEAGFFFDLILGASEKGNYWFFIPPKNNQGEPVEKTGSFHDKANIANTDYGFSAGIGIKIPLHKHFLLFKTDYKLGMRDLSDGFTSIYNRYFRFNMVFQL